MHRYLSTVLALAICSVRPAQSADISPQKLLATLGEQGGVCVILGASAKDITQLAGPLTENGKLTVHAVAAGKADLSALQEAARQASPAGAIAVEQIKLSPFPYRTTLMDVLLVADAEEAKALGYDSQEALNAVVPEGWVGTRTNGGWALTRKPKEPLFDDWTHEDHGADRNTVSTDKKVALPVGYRWNAGLPLNMSAKQGTRSIYFSTKTLAINGGQVYTIADSVIENLAPTFVGQHKKDQYLTARNAFNGMLLWRKKLFAPEKAARVFTRKPVLVAVAGQVYGVQDLNHLMALNGKTGELIRSLPTTYMPTLLVIEQGVAVVASLKNGEVIPGKKSAWGWPMRYHRKGSLHAFRITTGKELWAKSLVASVMLASEGRVFLIKKTPAGEGAMNTTESVEALDLKTGAFLWRAEGKPLKEKSKLKRRKRLDMDAAGYGTVAVTVGEDQYTAVFNAQDGRVLFEGPLKAYAHYINGRIYVGRSAYDPKTGAKIPGITPINKGGKACTPNTYANNLVIAGRGGVFRDDSRQNTVFLGARGSCYIGAIPAYGALYYPPNSCNCFPSQIPGYVVAGPNGPVPTAAEFAEVPVPQLGQPISADGVTNTPEPWPTYRGNAERSNAYAGNLPLQPKDRWTAQALASRPVTNITRTWGESLREEVTPAVTDGAMAYVAVNHGQQIQAYNQRGGALRWTFTAGGRINSAPTLHKGLCLFGAFDGYVYALHSSSGQLAWKMRMAPREERMVSYGKVESPWPVMGSVLVINGVGYASAGRSQGTDGGLAVRAFRPETGKVLWSKQMDHSLLDNMEMVIPAGWRNNVTVNDLMVRVGDTIHLGGYPLSIKDGSYQPGFLHEKINFKRQQIAFLLEIKKLKAKGEEENKAKIAEVDATMKTFMSTPPKSGFALVPGPAGFLNSTWTRVGERKYVDLVRGSAKGKLISWDKGIVGMLTDLGTKVVVQSGATSEVLARHSLPAYHQATTLLLGRNALIVAGGVYPAEGKPSGFLHVHARDLSKPPYVIEFAAPVAYNAVSPTNDGLVVVFNDGSLKYLE